MGSLHLDVSGVLNVSRTTLAGIILSIASGAKTGAEGPGEKSVWRRVEARFPASCGFRPKLDLKGLETGRRHCSSGPPYGKRSGTTVGDSMDPGGDESPAPGWCPPPVQGSALRQFCVGEISDQCAGHPDFGFLLGQAGREGTVAQGPVTRTPRARTLSTTVQRSRHRATLKKARDRAIGTRPRVAEPLESIPRA